MAKTVLVFPAGMPRSLEYLEHALVCGLRVIGSSSLGLDPARERYPEWVHLPYVTATNFNDALRRVITDFEIDGIFTPNPVVWDYLDRCLREEFPGVGLVNSSPVSSEVAPYQKALQFGAALLAEPLPLAGETSSVKPSLPLVEIAALYRHAETIPGMCDHEKMRALCEIFRQTPFGDVVEIGSWWGKSAFVLARLAKCYGIGNLLCVDPWSNEHLVQNDEQGFVDRVPVDADEALTVFQLNLLPYAHGAVNYLRLSSVDAAVKYRGSRVVEGTVFGVTHYTGRISVLHIDGNHSYENARADVEVWNELVLPGGWIVIDDYLWPYGDGPQRAANEFLLNWIARIECAFFMGGALFIKLKGSVA
jgi:hypothetical protein